MLRRQVTNMDQPDSILQAQSSEFASTHESTGYRPGVLAFAALGHVWVLGWLLLSACVLVGVVLALVVGVRPAWWMFWASLVALVLLGSSILALWAGNLEKPRGLRITAEDAPLLFDALARIRQKVKGPRIHEVYLDDEFNAGISQLPRWGGLGGNVNRLIIGMPLLMAMDRQRILAVLAHEYGHLRGGHGKALAWIYRSRIGWARFNKGLERKQNVFMKPTVWFMRWYTPRLQAMTLALARQDEYEADAIAARILGREVVASSLIEFDLKSQWMSQEYWPDHWRRALVHAQPRAPLTRLRLQALRPLPRALAYRSLQIAWKREGSEQDTHPVLRERVQALVQVDQPMLPRWSESAATELLGPKLDALINALDARWCESQRDAWQRRHAMAGVMLARVQSLRARRKRLSPEEWLEWGQLLESIYPAGRVQSIFKMAVAQNPHNSDACHALAVIQLEAFSQRADDALAQGAPIEVESAPEWPILWPLLEQLWAHAPHYRWWAARVAAHIWQLLLNEGRRLQAGVPLVSHEADLLEQPSHWAMADAARDSGASETQLAALETMDDRAPATTWSATWSNWVNWTLGSTGLRKAPKESGSQSMPLAEARAQSVEPARAHSVPMSVVRQLARWQAREQEGNALEVQAWGELRHATANLQQVLPATLRAVSQQMLRALLATYPQVQRAWLVRKPLLAMPGRPVHVLLIQFSAGVDAEQRQQLCEAIHSYWPGPGVGYCKAVRDTQRAGLPKEIAQTPMFERGMDFTPYLLDLCSHGRAGVRPRARGE